jgi:hypothetical protein
VPIVTFYKGVVTSVGRVSFFKDTHRIWISQKTKTSSFGIQRIAQHLFGHFRVCVFVTLGLEICSQCGFLAMAVAEDRDMELAV